ncbi:MAG: cupin domain-containing protein [Gemmatimonadota bacterium]
MSCFTRVGDHVGERSLKHHKATLFAGPSLMVGLNCLEPGQEQVVHTHRNQEKFYLVISGEGWFTVGQEERRAGVGSVIWAPRGIPHGVRNDGDERLVIFMGMAPPP